ncbi:discoidin domain-containing protein [Flammeovirga yaeyamensis]|uniref:Discoidin domain-containing protein n=1 Tax=Flammeovirga yaeyamensis TaxID=367791 RepID=A0AAX1N1C9_9BACT|nr:sugar-binding protein [Flammeovirga yaeyamensis]MBB3698340.1 hypothetical protein [Flammeovirga yaeyamensis]NMF34307.1 T9SS type A sorting domain-containing protein [Flammeovirga yaeyamensis]QWG01290.1 discoidin domain-containing protein [Flammeovirga yaeyamensis]
MNKKLQFIFWGCMVFAFLSTPLHAQTTIQECEKNVFVERDGYVVFEAENTTLNDYWLLTNSFDEDALGDGHIEFQGQNSYGSVVEESIITYKIQISNPGTYQVKWRSRNGKNAVKFDEENDSWIKVEATEYYGIKASTGEKVVNGNHFIKMWIQDLDKWSWNSFGEHHGVNGMNVYAYFEVPGIYEIQVAGRSKFHPIDRIALYQADKGNVAMNINTPAAELECEDESFKDYAAKREYKIKQLETPITIDGEAEALWDYVEAEKGNYEVNGNAISTVSDLNYTFKLAYDLEYLYLLAEVTDDFPKVLNPSSDKENGDAIELYFNPNNIHQENGAYDDDLMIRLQYGAENNENFKIGNWKAENDDNIQYTSTTNASGYLLEAKIPWNGILTDVSNLELRKMGFEISVIDRDANLLIENELNWANSTGKNLAKEDTRKFGTIQLDQKTYNYPFKTGWEIIYVDSEDTNGIAENAIDDDMETFWHTEWRDQKTALPHEVQIDMKQEYHIEEVHYYNRQDAYGPNGAIGDYEVYISNSSSEWGDPVAKGTLVWGDNLVENYKILQKIILDEPATGRYMKLVALSEAQNDPDIPFTAAAEFYIVGKTQDVTSVDRLEHQDISIYPNPTSNRLTIRSTAEIEQFKLFDMYGKCVIKGTANSIQLSDIASGVYILHVYVKGEVMKKRIIKQ